MKNYNIYIILIVTAIFLSSCSEDKIEFTGLGSITGKVIKKNSFEPIENAKVTINATNNSVFTNENGEFEFIDITEGDYSLEAEKEYFINGFEPVTVIADQNTNINIELENSDALNKPPKDVFLVSPTDNSTNIGIEATLTWNEAIDPDEDTIFYTLEVRNDLNNDILIIENLTEVSYTLTDLEYGVKYFWQIIATDTINDAVYSEIFAFETLQFPNNRFLFTRVINGNSIIFSADEFGNEIQLTSLEENCWRPRKNQVTNKIAFLKTHNSETHIFTMSIDGNNQYQVTSTVQPMGFKNSEIEFSWSTNGSQILYPHFDKLYKINANGSGNHQIYQTTDGSFITECQWSNDNQIIVLKTNNSSGYQVKIYTINQSGTLLNTILTGINGAAGGVDISANNQKILYCLDVSQFEDPTYRQLDTRLFIYDIPTGTTTNYSDYKTSGTNDLDAKFSPNEAEIIFTNTSNDGISTKNIYSVLIDNTQTRTELFSNASMPDWE